MYPYQRRPRQTPKSWYVLTDTTHIEITPKFYQYIQELRTRRDTEKEWRLFTEEMRNTGLGAATMRNLSEITSNPSLGRGDPMDME